MSSILYLLHARSRKYFLFYQINSTNRGGSSNDGGGGDKTRIQHNYDTVSITHMLYQNIQNTVPTVILVSMLTKPFLITNTS